MSHDFLHNCYMYHFGFSAKPSTLPLATPTLLKEVHNSCRLLSTPHSVPGPTYIPLKTAATSGLLLASTTLKLKVQGSNPARDIFSSHHHHVYVLMLACGSIKGMIIWQPARRAGTHSSDIYKAEKASIHPHLTSHDFLNNHLTH